jgi:hypothetical protein
VHLGKTDVTLSDGLTREARRGVAPAALESMCNGGAGVFWYCAVSMTVCVSVGVREVRCPKLARGRRRRRGDDGGGRPQSGRGGVPGVGGNAPCGPGSVVGTRGERRVGSGRSAGAVEFVRNAVRRVGGRLDLMPCRSRR